MTRDEVIRLAGEAGIPIEIDWAGRPSTLVVKDGGAYLRGVEDLERFAELVSAQEREACAKACDEAAKRAYQNDGLDDGYEAGKSVAAKNCAAAIRARSKE